MRVSHTSKAIRVSWKLLPSKVGTLYTAEASLNMALRMLTCLSDAELQRITPALIRMVMI